MKDAFIGLRLPEELKEGLKEVAKHNRRSMSNMIVVLIEDSIKEFKEKEGK